MRWASARRLSRSSRACWSAKHRIAVDSTFAARRSTRTSSLVNVRRTAEYAPSTPNGLSSPSMTVLIALTSP